MTADTDADAESDGPSLDGRVFTSTANTSDGDVGSETYFWFDQSDAVIHARYEGGTVRLGHLVGRHLGKTLDFRYTHLTTDGETATGHSVDRIERLDDGRLRLHEEWAWDSKEGSGSSVLEELTDAEYRTGGPDQKAKASERSLVR